MEPPVPVWYQSTNSIPSQQCYRRLQSNGHLSRSTCISTSILESVRHRKDRVLRDVRLCIDSKTAREGNSDCFTNGKPRPIRCSRYFCPLLVFPFLYWKLARCTYPCAIPTSKSSRLSMNDLHLRKLCILW